MSTLAQRLWREPAAFIAFLAAVLNVAQVLIVDNPTISAAIVALSLALAGQQTRARVSPTKEGGEPPVVRGRR
jgi:hypothetical protein